MFYLFVIPFFFFQLGNLNSKLCIQNINILFFENIKGKLELLTVKQYLTF